VRAPPRFRFFVPDRLPPAAAAAPTFDYLGHGGSPVADSPRFAFFFLFSLGHCAIFSSNLWGWCAQRFSSGSGRHLSFSASALCCFSRTHAASLLRFLAYASNFPEAPFEGFARPEKKESPPVQSHVPDLFFSGAVFFTRMLPRKGRPIVKITCLPCPLRLTFNVLFFCAT